jgi:hypothetical protein
MGHVVVGTQSNSSVKTPTLRQYAKEVEVIAARHLVTIIFAPGKYSNWTLVCEDKFRCSVPEDTELHGWLTDNLTDVAKDEMALFVNTDLETAKKGGFTLTIDTDENSTWEVFSWGMKGKIKERPKSKARGTRRKASADA